MRLELVQDWMSRDVVAAAPSLGLLDADLLMREHKIRRLPVVENGRLVGIVTYGDIREARPSAASPLNTWEMNFLLAGLKLSDVMARQLKVVSPHATMGEAAEIMLNNRISSLPVLDSDEKLVGIITESDIFRMVAHNWKMSQKGSTKPYTHYDDK
jgi:acetoin utilization protein AcuB